MNDNFTVKSFAPPITDLRCDPSSGALDIIIKDAGGFYIINARPPRSIADYQNQLRGWNPKLFFDAENEEKYVEGISRPLLDGQHMVRGKLASELRLELAKLKNRVSAPIPAINLNH